MSIIRRIEIRGYRLLQNFSWLPCTGVNVLLGRGDSGKTTVLSALGLFQQRRQLNEFDYYKRRTAGGFDVTVVVTGLARADLAAEGNRAEGRCGTECRRGHRLPRTEESVKPTETVNPVRERNDRIRGHSEYGPTDQLPIREKDSSRPSTQSRRD